MYPHSPATTPLARSSAEPDTTSTIGYLVPEFPGQTHTFFWRELKAFRRGKTKVDVVSSRRPHSTLAAHAWTDEAMRRTTYLHPPRQIWRDLLYLFRHPIGAGRCIQAAAGSQCDGWRARLRLIAMVAYAAKLSRLAEREHWIHLHCHMCSEIANLAMLANRLSGIPYSLTLHAPLSDFGPNQNKKWRHARFGIAITTQMLEHLRSELGDDVPAQMEVVPMGVDVTEFSRDKAYVPVRPNEPLRIVSCGRLNPCKGHATTIRAVERLRQMGRDVTLTIAGEDELGGGGYRNELERLVESSNLGGCVKLVGAIAEHKVRSLLEDAHVFVLASRGEPFGIAIAEAMAMEVPVIATAAGGVTEWLSDEQEALLVPADDPDAIAQAIVRLQNDPELCRTLASNGRSLVVDRYGSHRSAEVLLNAIGCHEWRLAPDQTDNGRPLHRNVSHQTVCEGA